MVANLIDVYREFFVLIKEDHIKVGFCSFILLELDILHDFLFISYFFSAKEDTIQIQRNKNLPFCTEYTTY